MIRNDVGLAFCLCLDRYHAAHQSCGDGVDEDDGGLGGSDLIAFLAGRFIHLHILV
jgi:hypothetical protein